MLDSSECTGATISSTMSCKCKINNQAGTFAGTRQLIINYLFSWALTPMDISFKNVCGMTWGLFGLSLYFFGLSHGNFKILIENKGCYPKRQPWGKRVGRNPAWWPQGQGKAPERHSGLRFSLLNWDMTEPGGTRPHCSSHTLRASVRVSVVPPVH